MNIIGAIAEIQWANNGLDFDGLTDPAIFVIGENDGEWEESAESIHSQLGHRDLDEFVVIEVTPTEWDIARRGQNINKGWFITDPDNIHNINKEQS